PFWIEGWALYWEMLMWDQGFPRTPEERVGMLFWRMHRAARILFSLRVHLGKMTPQEAVDFLVERVGHERANAEGEVRRSFNGSYPPLYQAAYMLGGLQFRALQRRFPPSRPLRVIRENGGRIPAAADDKGGVEGAAGGGAGGLEAEVQAPAGGVAEVGRGAVRRAAVHEDGAAFADGNRARR